MSDLLFPKSYRRRLLLAVLISLLSSLAPADAGAAGKKGPLAKIRPPWWKKPKEEARQRATLVPDPHYSSFHPQRPEGGYPWRASLWGPGVYGNCVNCFYSPVPGPAFYGAQAVPGMEPSATMPPVPFVLPAPFIRQKLPKVKPK